MMGVSGLSGDPALAADAIRRCRRSRSAAPARCIGKAMNKLGWHWWPSDTTVATMDYEGRARCINLGHCTPACAQGAKASHRHHLLAASRCAPASNCARIAGCARSPTNEHGMASGVVYYDKDGVEQFQPAEVVDHRLQRRRHAAAAAEFGLRPLPERARQFQRAGRQEPDVPSLRAGLRLCRRADRQQPRAADLPVEQGVLRHRSVARLCARLCHPVRPRRRAGVRSRRERGQGHLAVGRRIITASSASSTAIASRSSAICEDLPEEHNRVTLDPVLKDSHGIPAPRIDYTISENSGEDDGARHRARQEILSRRRRDRHLRQQPDPVWRLASARHRAHGHRSRRVRW